MSMISEQVERLRYAADNFVIDDICVTKMLKDAASTIEELSAKVRGMTESEKTALSYKEGWNDGFNCGMEAGEKACKRAFEDIRAEMQDGFNACVDIIINTKKGIYPSLLTQKSRIRPIS